MDFSSQPFDNQINEMIDSIESDMEFTDDELRKSNLAQSAAFYREQLTYPYEEYRSELTNYMYELQADADNMNVSIHIGEAFNTFMTYLQPPPGEFRG